MKSVSRTRSSSLPSGKFMALMLSIIVTCMLVLLWHKNTELSSVVHDMSEKENELLDTTTTTTTTTTTKSPKHDNSIIKIEAKPTKPVETSGSGSSVRDEGEKGNWLDWLKKYPSHDDDAEHKVRDQHIENLKVAIHEMAKKIEKLDNALKHDFIFVLQANHAIVSMVESFLCNTYGMKGVHERLMIMMVDKPGYNALKNTQFDVTVVDVSSQDALIAETFEFQQVGYWYLTEHRVSLMGHLLRNKINVFNIEADAVWIRNPLDFFETEQLISDYDIVYAIDGVRISFGFALFRATPASTEPFTQMQYLLGRCIHNNLPKMELKQRHPRFCSEQKYLTELYEKRSDLKTAVMDQKYFLDGQWYTNDLKHEVAEFPAVIQNNWIVGNGAKIERAEKWGHWFLDKHGKCDLKYQPIMMMTAQKSVISKSPPTPTLT